MEEKISLESQKRSMFFYGDASQRRPLPFFKEFVVKGQNADIPVAPLVMPEMCATKIFLGGIMGGVLGIGMGMFMGAMGDVSPIQIINGREVPQAPIREQFRQAYKTTGGRMGGWAKQFGLLTALFGGVECVIEKFRAKHDVWNPVASGCIVGATISAKAGFSASCIGCVGFSAFSLAVDAIMGDH
mmetsp:Transcript_35175/g.35816  ORF Transcript_35175/g.35816 Transcript_35175/m.35816 type:complete len:186 (+) Transcript_35175:203-760(+)|eukprot:CAMPEP_0182429156 /NCGR_PEP_ID=MMETSP1167-20130531/25554_1 /TAXON_ID=2988 /ORGANISM="Mallomonas Sp, Strain CCMP3275" /LENGTH=185 /DNA_ID=CAMNT_0024612509 /DNA_START=203 /DNA_END=760 /DNA_ORIENTATION=+